MKSDKEIFYSVWLWSLVYPLQNWYSMAVHQCKTTRLL